VSLRARLLVGLVALLGAGLVVADVATYWSLQSVQMDRIDKQLRGSVNMAIGALFRVSSPERGGRGPVPPGVTYTALYSVDGSFLQGLPFGLGASASSARSASTSVG